jgi:uncharacterized protein
LQVVLFNNHFTIHANKTLYWHDQNALIIADVHLGKSAHFRKNGMALPHYYAKEDIANLSHLLTNTTASKIFFLGDLFHSQWNEEWNPFAELIKNNNKQYFLIEGNHDIIDKSHYEKIGIQILTEFSFQNIYLTHEPISKFQCLNICGHIHPGILLQKPGHKALRLPCFYLKNDTLMLPAIGATTGLHVMNEKTADEVWIVTGKEVLKL